MYLKAHFDRYAETIGDPTEKDTFAKVVESIEFDARGMCVGGALNRAFSGTAVDHLGADLENRLHEFMRAEDFPQLKEEQA